MSRLRILGRVRVVLAVVRVLVMWPRIAVGAGLGRRNDEGRRTGRRWRLSSPAGIIVATRPRLSDFPRLSHWSVGPYGWTARLKLRPGDTVDSIAKAAPALRDAFRSAVVAARPLTPGWVELVALQRDPLRSPSAWAPAALSPTSVRVAVRDDGRPYVLDFRRIPHLLVAGQTGAGKSSLPTALVVGLADTDACMVGIDLKHGIEMAPLAPRLTRLARTPRQAADVLEAMLGLVAARARPVEAAGVKSVFDLPEGHPARRVVLLIIDEVAEIVLSPGKSDPDLDVKQRAGIALWRLVALSRFAGIFVVVAGQRFDSALAPQITSIRSQLGGRICGRADADTIRLTFGQEAPKDAVEAAASISADTPGVMVALDGSDWCRLRTLHVPTDVAAGVARRFSYRTPTWPEVLAGAELLAVAA